MNNVLLEFFIPLLSCDTADVFRSSRAPNVNGARRPIGSENFEARLRIKRCMSYLVIEQLVPLLTTKISLKRFHFSPSTSDVNVHVKVFMDGFCSFGVKFGIVSRNSL